MAGDGVDLLDGAGVDDIAGVKLSDVGDTPAVEGGGDEEIAGQEDSQGHEQPLGAYEYDGVYLEYIFVSGPFEQFLCFHWWWG